MTTTINVGELFFSEPGTKKIYQIELPVFDDPEFTVLPGQKIQLEAYNIDKAISLSPVPQMIEGKAICSRTNEEFILESELYPSERQYYLKRPYDVEEDEEFDQINAKSMEVDLEELLRESIFLGLPTVIISPKAKNEAVKHVEAEEGANTIKPFANLKDMLEE